MATTVEYDDLETSFKLLDAHPHAEAWARVSRETGEIFLYSAEGEGGCGLPDDINDRARYVEIPRKRDLGLGKTLAMRFVETMLPEDYELVEEIFWKKNAYSRFKHYLKRADKLDDWDRHERAATRDALCNWARDQGFEVRSQGNAQ